MRFRLKPIVFFMLCAFAPVAYDANEPPVLKPAPTSSTTSDVQEAAPTVINARQIKGKKDSRVEATGKAELRSQGQVIFADQLLYMESTREVVADGSVRLEQGDDVVTGTHFELNLDNDIGDMLERLEWGDIWQTKASWEAPEEQIKRLESWRDALQGRLVYWEGKRRELDTHGLLEEWRARDKEEWDAYLDQQAAQQETELIELRQAVDLLRQRLQDRLSKAEQR